MTNFVFITDLHISTSYTNRTGSPVDDLLAKLEFVYKFAYEHTAAVLIGGDLFHTCTVPREAYLKVQDFFKRWRYDINTYCIRGNHDMLFRSEQNNSKTDLESLYNTEFISSIDHITIDLGEVIITNKLPLRDQSKPQILMFHGFLGIKDGTFTVPMESIAVSSETLVLLGHDHNEHPVMTVGSATVIRPGSLMRVARDEGSQRQPQLTFITVKDGHFEYEFVTVPAKSYDECFAAKEAKSDLSQMADYESLVSELKNFRTEELTFKEVLSAVADEEAAEYVLRRLNLARSASK